MISWNVIRNSIALTLCAGLLAACQDRGQFKSYNWTAKELREHQLKAEADKAAREGRPAGEQPPAGGGAGGEGGDVTPPPPGGGGGPTPVTPGTPGAPPPAAGGEQDPKTPGFKPGAGAEIKGFSETASREEMIAENDRLVKTLSEEAANLVKGIDITIKGTKGNLTIAIDSAVLIGTDPNFLIVDPQPLANKDGKITTLSAKIVKTIGGQPTPLATAVVVTALCRDGDNCGEVQVRLKFGTAGEPVAAVFLLKIVGREYSIIENNIGRTDKLKTFKSAQNGEETSTTPPKEEPPAGTTSGDGKGDSLVKKDTPPAKDDSAPDSGTSTVAATPKPDAKADPAGFNTEVTRLQAANPAKKYEMPAIQGTSPLIGAKKPTAPAPAAPAKTFGEEVARLKAQPQKFTPAPAAAAAPAPAAPSAGGKAFADEVARLKAQPQKFTPTTAAPAATTPAPSNNHKILSRPHVTHKPATTPAPQKSTSTDEPVKSLEQVMSEMHTIGAD